MTLVQDPGRIADLARQIAAGELSPADLLERYLARIDAVDGEVAGWREIDRDGAMKAAAALADVPAGERSPLHGIPISIKDVIDIAGRPTRAGSRAREDIAHAPVDAEVVATLRAAGCVILGKSHTTEFAHFSRPPPTRNPHDTRCTPGGSSAGPAAVVAAGMAPASLGTQTAGSVSRPAAYCGIAAFKPSSGSLSTAGVVPLAARFDTVGIFGYRIEDAVFVFRALEPDFLTRDAPALKRVVRLEDPVLASAQPGVAESVDEAATRLAGAGIPVEPLPSPVPFADITDVHYTILNHDLARVHAPALAPVIHLVSDQFREALETGGAISDEAYWDARRRLEILIPRFWAGVPDDAAILFPAAPGPAPEGRPTGDPLFIIPFTALGGPMASLPAASAPNGLPLGVMLCAAPGLDHALAAFAEKAAPAVEPPR